MVGSAGRCLPRSRRCRAGLRSAWKRAALRARARARATGCDRRTWPGARRAGPRYPKTYDRLRSPFRSQVRAMWSSRLCSRLTATPPPRRFGQCAEWRLHCGIDVNRPARAVWNPAISDQNFEETTLDNPVSLRQGEGRAGGARGRGSPRASWPAPTSPSSASRRSRPGLIEVIGRSRTSASRSSRPSTAPRSAAGSRWRSPAITGSRRRGHPRRPARGQARPPARAPAARSGCRAWSASRRRCR